MKFLCLFKNWGWIEKRDPNQCNHRRKSFRERSTVVFVVQLIHAGLLQNNLALGTWEGDVSPMMQARRCEGYGKPCKQ